MRVCYTPRYYADIGEGHVFPIRKFELVRDRLVAEGTLTPAEIYEPREAPVADVLLAQPAASTATRPATIRFTCLVVCMIISGRR